MTNDSLGYVHILQTIMAGLLIYILVLLLLCVSTYIFRSIALYRMAEDRNIPHKWMAWIPLFNTAVLTDLAFKNYVVGVVMPVCYFIGVSMAGGLDGVLAVISFQTLGIKAIIGTLLVIAYYVLYVISTFKVYKEYSRHYILMTVISVITFGFTIPFMLFAIRKNQPINQMV